MKVSNEEAEQLRHNAREHGHFMVKLSDFGPKLTLAETVEAKAEQRRIVDKVIAPIVHASSEIWLYDSDCLASDWPEAERDVLHSLVTKQGRSVSISCNQDMEIERLYRFWAGGWVGADLPRNWSRGNVLFVVDDAKLPIVDIFAACTWASVLANQRSAVGTALYSRAKKLVQVDPARSVVALGDPHSLSRITIFAEGELMETRLAQVIEHARWYGD